jgi:Quinohemoprotein amine dehydrogenase, alpha subunit domain III
VKPLLLRTETDDLIGRLVLAACIILVLALVPHTAATAASPDGWATQTSGTTWTLNGIWGTSSTDIFAVGENGTILHYNGAIWDSMDSGVLVAMYDVWGSSSTDVFAVGQNGVICHYDGTGWSGMSSGTNKNLEGVWGTASDNVWAVGNNGTILNYDGTSWDNVTSNTGTHLNGIWGSCSTDVFAVGATGINGVIMHYDGANWSQSPAQGHPDFLGIWGAASDNVFVVGGQGKILRYDGIDDDGDDSPWDTMTTPVMSALNGVWGVSPTDIFAVGAEGRILHYDGNVGDVWSLMDSGVTDQIYSVWGLSSTDVYATGQVGTILHYRELPPEVSAVSPGQGNQGQTLDVIITGSNLDTVTSVSFGSGVSVNLFQADSSSQITANITIGAAASAGARDVSVSNPDGTDTLEGAFIVLPASIASVGPSTGKQGQALTVAILGANLGRTTSVAFGDGITVNNFTVQSPDRVSASITISGSASIGTRDVVVTTDQGSALLPGGFSVAVHDPAVASVSPPSGNQGQVLDVAIVGVNLDGTTGIDFGTGITVNSFVVQNAESVAANITIDVSALLGARNVAVSAVDGTAVLPSAFSVTAELPAITDAGPRSGKIGQTLSLSITGANLGSTRSVSLGAGIVVEGFVSAPDQITVSIVISGDASLGARDVSVTTDGGTATLAGGFIVYRLPPGVIGINPAYGETGQTLYVIISGVNFFGTTGVDFGPGIKVNSFTVDSDMQITVYITILEGTQGGLQDVQITTAAGSVDFPNGFDLRVNDSPGGPSSSNHRPAGPADLWWVPVLLGGFAAVILMAVLLVIRRKRDSAKESSSAP